MTIVTNAEMKDAPKGVEDIPLDQITDLAKNLEEVTIRLCRRNERGQVATVYNGIRVRVADLAKIDDWAREMAGGGRYRCEVKDPMDASRYVMSPFWFSVEGPPRPPRFLGSPEAPMPAALANGAPSMYNPQGGPPSPQTLYNPPQPGQQQYTPPPGNWANGLHADNRQGYVPAPYYAARPMGALAPGATTSSDEVALKQVGDLKAELAQARAEMKATSERLATENARLRDEVAARDRQVAEERHNAEIRALTARLEALSQRPEPPPPPKTDLKDYAALAAALAPVFTTLVTSQRDAAAKSLEVQQQGLQTLMQATLSQTNKTSDLERMITTLGPVIMPLLTEQMKSRSPEAQAGLFQAMAENNLNSVAMMAQLIEAFASAGGKEEPWYLPMIKEALGGVVQVAQAYTQSPGGLPGQPALPPSPVGMLAASNAPAAPPSAGYSTLDEAPARTVAPAPRPAGKVPPSLELLFSLLPSEFQTPEWRAILQGMHAEPPLDAQRVAAMLASHIEHLVTFNLLPGALAQVTTHPRASLEALLEKLPVARTAPQYARTVLDTALAFLAEDGFAAAGQPAPEVVEEAVEEADEGETEEGEESAAE